MALLRKWSEAAILGQPLDYLHAVWLDTIRLFDPNHRSYGDLLGRRNDRLHARRLPPANSGQNGFVEYWQHLLYPHDPPRHRGDIGPLKQWERITRDRRRLDGAVLLALCLAGPWVLRVPARSGMILFGSTALTLLFFPILIKGYDYRFVIPAFGPLLAAGALAAWGLVVRLRPKLRVATRALDP